MAKQASKKQVAEQIWLSYFNQYLFEHGVITEEERNKMALKIERRCQAAQQQK